MALGGATREFMLKIVADVKDATKGMDQVEKASGNMKDKVLGIGKAVAGGLAVGAVVGFGKASLDAAADAQQAMNGVRNVFGASADKIEEFSGKAIKSMGISDDAYQAFATTTGGLLQDMGVPLDTTITMTDELAQRGADLAQVYGVDAEQAMTALQKGLGGSTKGLKALGISLTKGEIEARALANGWVDADGKVTQAGKAMATQQLIMEKSGKAAGEFGKHSGEVANQQKILALQFEETQETIGTKLLPIISTLLEKFVPLLDFTMKYADILVPIAGVILGIVAAFKLYELGQMAVKVATTAWTGVQWLLNSALLANPIGIVVAAIAALTAGVVWAYQNVDWFRALVDAVFNWIKNNWPMLLAILTGPIGAAVFFIIKYWDEILAGIQWVWNWIKDNWPLLLTILTGPIGAAVWAITAHWDKIKEGAATVFRWIRDNWPLLLAILTGPFGIATLAIIRNWDTIRDFFYRLPGQIQGYLSNLWNIIKYPFVTAADAVKNAFEPVKDFFYRLPGQINNWLSNVGNIIKYPFEQAFNAIKYLWNNTVGRISFTVPSWVPGIGGKGWSAPRLAEGGIVNRPTLALIGEAGPEAVVPLGRGGGFGNTVINVYALTANAEVGRVVYNALREYERTSGK